MPGPFHAGALRNSRVFCSPRAATSPQRADRQGTPCPTKRAGLRRKNGVPVEVGIGPHVDHDVQVADFNETRLPAQKYYDQHTGLELDPVGKAAARQSEIDFAWRLKAFEPRPPTEAYQRMGRKPFGMRWTDCNNGMSSDQSFGVVWSTKRHVRLAPSASRTSLPSHQARHRSKLFVCFPLS